MLAANGPGLLPALIAIVTDPAGALLGLQRTYLTEDGRKAATKATDTDRKPKVKYSLGNVVGGSIQLGPPAASMLVTEGLEDGLTLAQALGRSVWVAAGTSMMPQMCLDRLAPPRKDAPITIELPPIASVADAVAASSAVLAAVAAGDCTPDEGGRVMALLTAHKAIVETGELERRISSLEERDAK